MNFAKTLERLRVPAENGQRGIPDKSVIVDRRDLRELLHHFNRVDALHREQHAKIEALEAENAALKTQLAEARKDAARLDWLLNRSAEKYEYPAGTGWVFNYQDIGLGKSAREAIDAAMKESEGV